MQQLHIPATATDPVRIAVHVAGVRASVDQVGVVDHADDQTGRGGVDRGALGCGDVDAVVAGTAFGPEPGHEGSLDRFHPATDADALLTGTGRTAGLAGNELCRFRELMSSPERGALSVPGDSS